MFRNQCLSCSIHAIEYIKEKQMKDKKEEKKGEVEGKGVEKKE